MSNKEATVYVINVGKSMGVRHNGREVSDLEYAMSYVWDSLARLISTGRKLDNAAIVGVGTDGTPSAGSMRNCMRYRRGVLY